MGLLKAVIHAASSTMADQWKEFFYCDSLPNDVLVVKGRKRTSSRSSNTKGADNIITNGSGIAVADGQCMIIVDNGRVVEICAEPGQYTYDMSTEPSIFSGNLGKGIVETFKAIGKRAAYGGDTGHDQRVYYFNTKEMLDNLFGTIEPVQFRVVYPEMRKSFTVGIKCNGQYTYRIEDPLLFYTNVCGNVTDRFTRADIERQLKSEFLNVLNPAFSKISDMGIRYDQLPAHNPEITQAIQEALDGPWRQKRGLSLKSVTINSATVSKEDMARIQKFEDLAWNTDPMNAAAILTDAQAKAMQTAAGNSAGAMMGFMGLNMAQQQGGMNAQDLYAMGMQQNQQNQQNQLNQQNQQNNTQPDNSWTCACGAVNTGKFCQSCGKPKPAPAADGWTCECGAVNKGKFCQECGKKKPAGAPLYRCDKCGWQPADPAHPPKFCPECGDVFDENDVQ